MKDGIRSNKVQVWSMNLLALFIIILLSESYGLKYYGFVSLRLRILLYSFLTVCVIFFSIIMTHE